MYCIHFALLTFNFAPQNALHLRPVPRLPYHLTRLSKINRHSPYIHSMVNRANKNYFVSTALLLLV